MKTKKKKWDREKKKNGKLEKYIFLNKLLNIMNNFVEAYEKKDTMQIARNHSCAITEGIQDSVGSSGRLGPFAYLFWFPYRRTIDGIATTDILSPMYEDSL